MKCLYIIMVLLFAHISMANQDTKQFLEQVFLSNVANNTLSLNIKNKLEKYISSEILSNYLKHKNNGEGFIFSFTAIGNAETPYISNYTVYNDKVRGIKVSYNYISNNVVYRIIEKTISKSIIAEIHKKISRISFIEDCSSKFKDEGSKNLIIIFNRQIKEKNKIDTIAIYPKTLFPKGGIDNHTELLLLRAYILNIIGLDNVESDLSNISTTSLVSKLHDNSIVRYKSIDNAINLYLKGIRAYGLDKAIWQYVTSSDSAMDKYIALWLIHIDKVFSSETKLSDAYLFQDCYLPYVKQIDPNKNILHKYILYRYYIAIGDKEKEGELLTDLKELKMSNKLL